MNKEDQKQLENKIGGSIDLLVEAIAKGFYGEMYGGPVSKESVDKGHILFIKSGHANLSVQFDRSNKGRAFLYYEWGWPGPDYNKYYLEDYGITWALSPEDFKKIC